MKNIIPFFILFVFLSCKQNPEKKYSLKIKEYFKSSLKNPDSFEIVSITKIDTFYYGKEYQKNIYRQWMDSKIANDHDKISALKESYVEKRKNKDYNYIKVIAKIRGENSFGGKTVNDYSFYFNNQDEITDYDNELVNLDEGQFRIEFGY